jgi:short-subunit dehydrogenase
VAGLAALAGRIAVVTGASSGIGAETARALARRGAAVALVARRRERLEALAAELCAAGGRASAHACDVADRAQVAAAAAAIEARWGRVDLLVNAAGVASHVLFVDQALEEVEALVRTNFLGPVYWIRQVLPGMRARGEGWIVNLSSFAGKVSQPDEAVYSATKFALTGLSQALAFELAPLGIHVLCVHPALVRTEMFTEAVLARMPRAAVRQFIEPDVLVREMLRALRRGETDLVVPRRFAWLALLRNAFPGSLGRMMARIKLEAASPPSRGDPR